MGFSCLIVHSCNSHPMLCAIRTGLSADFNIKRHFTRNGWFCLTWIISRWKTQPLLWREGFCNTSFRALVWQAIMQWLAQYLAEKTLARSDALDLLAVRAQLAASNAIRRGCSLARMKGEGRPMCCSFLVEHWLLPLLCLHCSPVSGCACIWQLGKNFVPQNSGCFSPWLGRCRLCNIWG